MLVMPCGVTWDAVPEQLWLLKGFFLMNVKLL